MPSTHQIPLSSEVLSRIVEKAGRAPSGDNCQPWKFSWDGKVLKITHDETRAKHSLNRGNHSSLISLGCVLESLEIAASAEKLEVITELDEEKLKQAPQAMVHFQPSDLSKHELYETLDRREVDRRPYQGGSLEAAFVARFPSFYFTNQISKPLSEYVSQCECLILDHQAPHQDLMKWLRLSDREARQTRDGLPWRNLGISFFEVQVLLRLVRNYSVQKFFNGLGAKEKYRSNVLKLLRSSAGMGLITVKSRALTDLVQAGKTWFRIWCRLNLQGYGFHPYTASALLIYDAVTGDLPADLLPLYRDLYTNTGPQILKEVFHYGPGEIPVLLFRTGKTTPLPEKARTLRRALNQIFSIVKE